jgi:Domain of unknown function (DUF1952)
MAEPTRKEWIQRGIPLKLFRDYLVDLGGSLAEDGRVDGPGWQARLERVEDFHIGSLRIGQVRVEFEGQPEALDLLLPQLEKKLLRAGA